MWWSPEQISASLVTDFPDDLEMRVSHETIYLSLFVQSRGALRKELYKCLRTGRAMRRPIGKRNATGQGRIRNMVMISERPAEVADRAVPGHWEGDLIFGKKMTSIGTLVERHSRYVIGENRVTGFAFGLFLLIVLAAIDPRKIGVPAEIAQSETFSLYRIVIIVALTGWTTVARLVRAETLSLKARDFTRAAQALGARPERLMFRHILPNAAGSLVVATTLSAGTLILLESTLSFLGLGTQPPAASWGNMLTGAQELLQQAPVLALWPGLLIFLTVIAFNFVGDGLQDALDPRSERR